MATATLTSKGQVTIPASVRAALGLDAGSRIEFVEIDQGRFAIIPVTATMQELKGVLRKPARHVTIEDMNEAIASEAAKSARQR